MAALLDELDRFKAARASVADLLGDADKRSQDAAFQTLEKAARTETSLDDNSEEVRAAVRFLANQFGLSVRQGASRSNTAIAGPGGRPALVSAAAASPPEQPPARGPYEVPGDRRNVDLLRALSVSQRFEPADPGAHTLLVRKARAAELALNNQRLAGGAAYLTSLERCDLEQRSADQHAYEALGGARRDFIGANYGAPPIGAGYHYFDGSAPLYRQRR